MDVSLFLRRCLLSHVLHDWAEKSGQRSEEMLPKLATGPAQPAALWCAKF